jgi:FERM central domain
VLVARGASVKDVLVSLRRIIGLKADADFSLCMRSENPSTGHDTFACLPDVMSAEEAEALASVENRSLVYKRRIYLPPLSGPEAEKVEVARRKSIETEAAAGIAGGSGGGAYDPGLNFDLPDVDTEAQAATSITDGAHSLLYLEAVFHVTKGYYLLPLQDCLILAGLQLISQKGRVSEADRNALASNPNGAFQGHPNLDLHNVYKPLLASVLSAQAIAEHKATSGKPVEDLLVACRREHARLSTTLDAFAAQRVYIKRVKQLPEYGGATFFATYQRLFADVNGDPKGSRSAAPTPAWADSVVCEDIHAPSAPKPLPVIVVINAVGVHVRPLPPWHNPSLVLNYSAVTPVSAGGDKVAASLSHELSPSEEWSENGSPVPWYVHKVELIEVWGVKKSRPTFTYRVRENQLRIAELTSPSFKEMAST